MSESVIIAEMKKVQELFSAFYKYGGLGYCAFISIRLRENLLKMGIVTDLVSGSIVRDTPEGNAAIDGAMSWIKIMDENDNSFYGEIKRHYNKVSDPRPRSFGHVAVMYKGVIYDATSDQFKMPNIYSAYTFSLVWEKTFISNNYSLIKDHMFNFKNRLPVDLSKQPEALPNALKDWTDK